MQSWFLSHVRALAAALIFVAPMALATEAQSQTVADDGVTVKIAGRSMRCGQTPVIMDSDIPSEGLAVPGEALYLNPTLMRRLPGAVRVFIFKHECAHKITGPDELGADCIAAKSGAREGWLKASDIDAVCRSFAGPATSTHPSGKTRCANIRRCYGGTQIASTKSAGDGVAKTSSWSSSPEERKAAEDDGAQPIEQTAPAAE